MAIFRQVESVATVMMEAMVAEAEAEVEVVDARNAEMMMWVAPVVVVAVEAREALAVLVAREVLLHLLFLSSTMEQTEISWTVTWHQE